MRCRPPGAAPARQPRPLAADDVTLPAQDRAGNDDQPHRRQTLRPHRPCKQRQPRPVRPRQTRMSAWPLALSHSELMAQHKDLGVLPPPLPPRQAQQRHGTVTIKKISFKPTSRRSSHALAGQDRPGMCRTRGRAVSGASGQVAQVFGTHRHVQVVHWASGPARSTGGGAGVFPPGRKAVNAPVTGERAIGTRYCKRVLAVLPRAVCVSILASGSMTWVSLV